MARKKAKIRNKKRFVAFIIVALVVLFALGALLYLNHLKEASGPLDPSSTQEISLSVPGGTSTEGIALALKEAGIIGDAGVFVRISQMDGYDGRFKAGQYQFSPSQSMKEIMELLVAGQDETLRFTIPEGYDIRRTAERLAEQSLVDKDAFLEEVEKGDFEYSFVSKLPDGPSRLEGYLFPETYEVFSNATEHEIIDKMLGQFDSVFTEEYYDRAEELGLSLNEVMTLASIIEREAVVQKDRPVIAGVFYNRLKSNMPLQSCATVQYILGEQKAVLSIADTKIDSPYNTYLNPGLPPGPICSPGQASIKAALWPEETDYYYFLAKGDGSHVFSKTFEEHKRNKAKYID